MFVSPLPTSNPTTSTGRAEERLEEDEGRQFVSLAEIGAFLRRHAVVIVTPIVVAMVLAGTYAKLATPIYTARAQLIIDPRIPEQARLQSTDTIVSLDTAQVESQIAVLRSERIANMVIEQLGLARAPDFQPKPSLLDWILGWFRAPAGPLPAAEEARRIMETFAEGLDVRRAGLSYAIDVSFSSPDPVRAAEVASAVAEAYIEDQLAARAQAARMGGDWLKRRMLDLRDQMNAANRAVQEFRASHDYRIPRTRDERPAGEASDTATPRNTLEELETTANTYRKVYESFLQGFMEAVQRQSFPVSDARILTQASPPLAPSEPRGKLIVALGALLGAMVGGGFAVARHHLDRSVRNAHQLRTALGTECLGRLPLLPDVQGDHYFNGVLKQATPEFRDGLIAAKTLIELHGRANPLHCFGITSVTSGEGKSTLASNLATLFALAGQHALVIDADMRSRMLTRRVAPRAELGLVQVLQGTAPLQQAIVPMARGRVDFLPFAGPEAAGSGNLLGSDAMHLMMLEAVQAYDVVIIDLPSLMPVDAGLALTGMLDGVVLAVECGTTTVEALAEATHWLDAARAKVLGAIITKVQD